MDERMVQQLEAYLDGLLPPAEAAAFERRLRSDAELSEALRQQQSIDSALRRLLPVPASAPAVVLKSSEQAADVAGRVGPARPTNWLQRLAVAAVLAAGVFGAWSTWNYLKPASNLREIARVSAEVFYRARARDKMVYYVCQPDSKEFAHYFRAQLGQGLLMSIEDPGVKCLGVSTCNTITPDTLAVVIMSDETPIVVFVDRRTNGCELKVAPDSGLHVHRQEIGSLILYEVSPMENAQVLDLFRNPDDTERSG